MAAIAAIRAAGERLIVAVAIVQDAAVSALTQWADPPP